MQKLKIKLSRIKVLVSFTIMEKIYNIFFTIHGQFNFLQRTEIRRMYAPRLKYPWWNPELSRKYAESLYLRTVAPYVQRMQSFWSHFWRMYEMQCRDGNRCQNSMFDTFEKKMFVLQVLSSYRLDYLEIMKKIAWILT